MASGLNGLALFAAMGMVKVNQKPVIRFMNDKR